MCLLLDPQGFISRKKLCVDDAERARRGASLTPTLRTPNRKLSTLTPNLQTPNLKLLPHATPLSLGQGVG